MGGRRGSRAEAALGLKDSLGSLAGGGWQFQLNSPGSLCAFPWSSEGT